MPNETTHNAGSLAQQIGIGSWDVLRDAADVLSEAAVEIANAYGPGNIVAGRCRELVRKIDEAREGGES